MAQQIENAGACPFCGVSDSFMVEMWIDGEEYKYVTCRGCGAEGPPHLDEAKALELWDRRA